MLWILLGIHLNDCLIKKNTYLEETFRTLWERILIPFLEEASTMLIKWRHWVT